MQQLVKGTVQRLALQRALFNYFCSHCLNVDLSLTRHNRLASIKRKAQIVERLLLESLILRERRHNLGGNDMQQWLEEVKEADVTVLVCVEQLHVFVHLQIDI